MGLGLGGLGTIIGVVALALLAVPLLVAGVFVVLVVSNRAEPDPTGRRPAVVYASAVSFISLFATLFATYAVVASLTSLIGSHPAARPRIGSPLLGSGVFAPLNRPAGPLHPVGDAAARGVVLGLLVAAVAGFVYLLHSRTARRTTDGLTPEQPAARVRSSYLAAVCFVSVFIAVIATVVAAYQVFQMIAPGVFHASGTGSATVTLRSFLPLVYLALASVALLVWHLRALPPEIRPSLTTLRPGSPSDPAAGPATPDVVGEVPVVEVEVVEVLDAGPPPRKRTTSRRKPPGAPSGRSG